MRHSPLTKFSLCLLTVFFITAAGAADGDQDQVVTLIFTNDMESAYAPVPAWWRDDMEHIGGIAELTTLIKNVRRDEPNVFLFDAGDIFTGALSRLTDGALMFEFMTTMGYDAMAIGNHEFDYGEAILLWQKNRAAFPVLSANLFFKGTEHPFAQRHTIIERNGIRIGVVGLLGQDAASTAIARDHIDELDVTDPAAAAQKSVDELRDDVDLIILLTHQGHTAPMQTDAEADPRLTRDIDKDIALADAVTGVDVLFGGHADAGTWEPVVSPINGTLIMQTFGQATYLGYLQLTLDAASREIKSYDGKLIPVNADVLEPDAEIERKNSAYRDAFPEITEVVGRTERRLNRKYFDESDLGNLLADVCVDMTDAEIGMMHPGGIRKDFPQGDIEIADILDTNPFVDPMVVVAASGAQIRAALEQSATHLRGLMQVSASLRVIYDSSKPERQRIVSVKYKGEEISDEDSFKVCVSGIISKGGDHYDVFTETDVVSEHEPLGDMTIAYFRKHGTVPTPKAGRQTDLAVTN
jgi:2',3'-cyclic-nucleotide 2'-phosphodiesterase (5'-nucleotidase family)